MSRHRTGPRGWDGALPLVDLALDDLAEFGLSRFSASRGLDMLERVGLVSTIRRPGVSPIATILDANALNG